MTPWVMRLMIANVVVFVLTLATATMVPWIGLLGFRVVDIMVKPWSPITYMFMHAGLWHLAFNMIGLYFFGPRLEARLGSSHFLGLYFVAGLTGAAFSILTPYSLIVGASGAVLGVLLGFARYWPTERIYIMAVLPMEARLLVIIFAGLSIGAGLMGVGGIAHFAHLGGFAGAWGYLTIKERNSAAEKFRRRVEKAAAPRRPPGKTLEQWKSIDPGQMHPLNREEYERIIRKADDLGVGALSLSERAFMERLTNR